MFSGQELNSSNIIINNDGFWPDLDVAEFERERSMSLGINPILLRDALVSAVVEINISLSEYQVSKIAQGITKADQLGVVSVNGQSSTVLIYKKAVFARAKSDLVGEFVSISNRSEKIDENQTEMKNSLLAESTREVRKIKGLKRVTVALI